MFLEAVSLRCDIASISSMKRMQGAFTIAFSNMFRMFSSDSPDTPEISSVDVTLRSGKFNSLINLLID